MSGGMEHGAAKRTSRMTMANIKSQHTEDTGNSRAGNANLATFGSKIYTFLSEKVVEYSQFFRYRSLFL